MKKSVLLALLGVAVNVQSYGQGHIEIGNYQPAYNAVVWQAGPRAGLGVLSSEGVSLTLWYGEGNLSEDTALGNSVALNWHTDAQSFGFPGYYQFLNVALPQWAPGDVYTFQVRASGAGVREDLSRSAKWTELAAITSSVPNPNPPIPLRSSQSIGLVVVVPEPSTFALAGLGSAALMIFRRRSS